MRITPELISAAEESMNALGDREIVMRNLQIPTIENLGTLKDSFQTFSFSVPHPVIGLVLGGLHWSFLKIILVTAIPFGIYDLVEAMDNVVSASAAGDEYPTTRVLTADGVLKVVLGAVVKKLDRRSGHDQRFRK